MLYTIDEVLAMDEMKRVVFFALEAGKVLLESGAETYRVEDTLRYILNSRDITHVESFVIPTGIFIAARRDDEIFSYIMRIYGISTDLRRIARVNELSRDFVSSHMPCERANRRLESIKTAPEYGKGARYLLGGGGAAFTAILFGGTYIDFIVSIFVSALTLLAIDETKKRMDSFIINVVGGFVAATSAIAIDNLLAVFSVPIVLDANKVIIGALMTMVPGVAITNAVRDSISGDYVSGMSRTLDAIVIAISIALGVGIAIKLASIILGQI
jgi:uncharacterized membrane protein YjjP (DUF1212 family)